MKSRPYQEQAISEIRNHFKSGRKKVILHLATGAGKTWIFSLILKSAAAKGTRCILAVRGRQLVDQASYRLTRENVEHGVKMSNDWRKNPKALVQICSIDTLSSRNEYPPADLVIIDECHMAISEGYRKFCDQYPNAFFLGVTATPWTIEPLTHVGTSLVEPITMQELIDQNFLVKPRYFGPFTPDLVGVQKSKGDYVASQLETRMSTLTGDIIGHWKQYGENRPTILFACNISHSLSLVSEFRANGVNAEHIEGNHSFAQRKDAIARLERGEISILSNCGVLCTGVDIPFVSCIVMARPTYSYNLFIQQCGRGTRICEGKSDFLIFDHAGNIRRHGFITDERDVDLDGRKKEKLPGDEPQQCKVCYAIFERGLDACPECGAAAKNLGGGGGDRQAVNVPGDLIEILKLTKEQEIEQFITRLKETAKKRGYKRGWTYFQFKEKYGEALANQYFPKRVLPPWLSHG